MFNRPRLIYFLFPELFFFAQQGGEVGGGGEGGDGASEFPPVGGGGGEGTATGGSDMPFPIKKEFGEKKK